MRCLGHHGLLMMLLMLSGRGLLSWCGLLSWLVCRLSWRVRSRGCSGLGLISGSRGGLWGGLELRLLRRVGRLWLNRLIKRLRLLRLLRLRVHGLNWLLVLLIHRLLLLLLLLLHWCWLMLSLLLLDLGMRSSGRGMSGRRDFFRHKRKRWSLHLIAHQARAVDAVAQHGGGVGVFPGQHLQVLHGRAQLALRHKQHGVLVHDVRQGRARGARARGTNQNHRLLHHGVEHSHALGLGFFACGVLVRLAPDAGGLLHGPGAYVAERGRGHAAGACQPGGQRLRQLSPLRLGGVGAQQRERLAPRPQRARLHQALEVLVHERVHRLHVGSGLGVHERLLRLAPELGPSQGGQHEGVRHAMDGEAGVHRAGVVAYYQRALYGGLRFNLLLSQLDRTSIGRGLVRHFGGDGRRRLGCRGDRLGFRILLRGLGFRGWGLPREIVEEGLVVLHFVKEAGTVVDWQRLGLRRRRLRLWRRGWRLGGVLNRGWLSLRPARRGL
mmetsp:Transcript_10045/g.18897  ORF Transcript_10045/g.18897 Transcript_10045/m.18897 type:complete len:495 (-) Transcript_10045:1592-3076(-)